jgi:hypothetical protein
MSHHILNQTIGYIYTQYSFRRIIIRYKNLFSEEALYTSPMKKHNNSPGFRFAHLVGAIHVADQVDHTGA